MAQESQNGQRDESIRGGKLPLYSEFEDSFLKVSSDEAKSLWQKYCLKMFDLPGLSRKNTSSHKKEPVQIIPGNESSSSNNFDPRVMSESKLPSPDYKVHGFYNEELSMEKMLLKHRTNDHQFKAIGVVGMAGVGKTTLCQKIFNRTDVRSEFVPRIWACMPRPKSDGDNLEVETVKIILERLGVEEETINSFETDRGFGGLIYILKQQLIGKKYLIVLDEFLDVEGWCKELNARSSQCETLGNDLLNVFPKGYGGTVIVASRNEESIKKMVAEENLLKLLPLSDPVSCWSIYRDTVLAEIKNFEAQTSKELREKLYMGKSGDRKLDEKQIEEIEAKLKDQEKAEEELKGKCGGLPLAAKLMGIIKARLTLEQDAELPSIKESF